MHVGCPAMGQMKGNGGITKHNISIQPTGATRNHNYIHVQCHAKQHLFGLASEFKGQSETNGPE